MSSLPYKQGYLQKVAYRCLDPGLKDTDSWTKLYYPICFFGRSSTLEKIWDAWWIFKKENLYVLTRRFARELIALGFEMKSTIE